jgi:hypothetical protein
MADQFEVTTTYQEPRYNLVGFKQLVEALRPIGFNAVWLKAKTKDGSIPHLKVGKKAIYNLAAVESKLQELAAGSLLDEQSTS